MNASEQGHSQAVIEAPPASIWAVLTDSSLLPEWVPAVTNVVQHAESEEPGSIRRCDVTFGGKEGHMVERCVEAIEESRLRYVVDDDSFGFGRMLENYSFTLELTPDGGDRTRVTLRSFYSPRGIFARVLNALMLRRRFGRVREEILVGLGSFMTRSGVG